MLAAFVAFLFVVVLGLVLICIVKPMIEHIGEVNREWKQFARDFCARWTEPKSPRGRPKLRVIDGGRA